MRRLFVCFLTLAAVLSPALPSSARADDAPLAARVKEIFRAHCRECHEGAKANAGVKILEHATLLEKEKVAPKSWMPRRSSIA